MRVPALPRPTYANVVSTLALVIALGGTAYAANTVGTVDIQNQAVTTPKLADEAVTSVKLAPSAVGSAQVSDNSLTLADLKGADLLGKMSFSLAAHACHALNLSVTGVATGQSAFITWTTALPPNIVFGPLRVVSTTQVSFVACNLGAVTATASGAGFRLVTFG